MCSKCGYADRYPYYGLPVTPESSRLRDEAERCRESALRCFIAESDCDNPNVLMRCGVNRVARVLRRVSCAAMRDGWNWRAPYNARPSNTPIVLIASVCADLFQAFGREPINHAHQSSTNPFYTIEVF